jgi:hypothetical protein
VLQLLLHHLSISQDFAAAVFENERATDVAALCCDATSAEKRHSGKKQGKAKPVILRAVGGNQVDAVGPTEARNPERGEGIEASAQGQIDQSGSEVLRACANLALRVAHEPGLMAVRIQPVYLEAGSVFLASPAAAALDMQNIHEYERRPPRLTVRGNLGAFRAFFENIIMNGIDRAKGAACHFRIRDADTESFFHTDGELQRVDRIKTEPVRAEKGQVIADLLDRRLEHQVFDEHLLDALA